MTPEQQAQIHQVLLECRARLIALSGSREPKPDFGLGEAIAMCGPETSEDHVEQNLALLLIRVIHRLHKYEPNNCVAQQAGEYLHRNGLAGNILRVKEEDASGEPGYVAQGGKDEDALIDQDFYVNSEGILPPADITEADKAQAWRWYGFKFLEQTEQMIGLHAWRLSRERQLIAALNQLTEAQAEIAALRGKVEKG